MLLYYIQLGVRSLRRNVVLNVLLILAIGVGVGSSMTTLTVFRAMSGDPIPAKSHRLFIPQIDSRGPQVTPAPTPDQLQTSLTYTDASALMQAHAAKRQSAMYGTLLSVYPGTDEQHPGGARRKPFRGLARAVYADFFPMFDVPFRYGGPWNKGDDESRSAVVVLTAAMNERLFGGVNSVGRTLRLGEDTYVVRGVLEEWRFTPVVYDLERSSFAGRDEMFVPFTRAIDSKMMAIGSISCDEDSKPGFDGLLRSQCQWLSVWVELADAAQVQRYRSFLTGYAAEQQRIGRFRWAPHTQLRDVTQWLVYRHVVPSEIRILMLVSFGFLLVCLLNAMGLMLAKIMARTGDISVRRALGASRGAIFWQCLTETALVGTAGGLVGVGLTAIGLLSARALLPKEFALLTRLDPVDIGIALLLSVTATVAAGLYPTWRAAQVSLSWQLKAQ